MTKKLISTEDPWCDKEPYKDGWPKGVRPLSFGAAEDMGFDRKHRLYWCGELLVTENRFSLSWWQAATAVAVAIATVGMALMDFLRFMGWVPGS